MCNKRKWEMICVQKKEARQIRRGGRGLVHQASPKFSYNCTCMPSELSEIFFI